MAASSNVKQYGLISSKAKKSATLLQKPSIFNESSDEDEQVPTLEMQRKRQAATQTKIKKQTQLEIQRALEADPTVYEYDSIYDDMERKKEEQIKAAKTKISGTKPKYIEGLLKSAEQRKKEQERRKERKIQKEREKEGEMYGDKEAFVTSAYKKKMQELAEEEERERREAEEEAANDVTKQKDLSGFYRHILAETTGEVRVKEEKDSDEESRRRDEGGKRDAGRKVVKTERHIGLNIKERDKQDRGEHYRRRKGSGGEDDDDDHRRHTDRWERERTDGHRRDKRGDRRDQRSGEERDDRHSGRRDYYDRRDNRRGEDDRGKERDSRRHERDDRRDRRMDEGRREAEGREAENRGDKSGVDSKEEEKESIEVGEKSEEKHDATKSVQQEIVDANADADSDIDIDSESSDEENEERPAMPTRDDLLVAEEAERQAREAEKKAKFAKRAGSETVMSARDRYLARKAARDTSRAHIAPDDD